MITFSFYKFFSMYLYVFGFFFQEKGNLRILTGNVFKMILFVPKDW